MINGSLSMVMPSATKRRYFEALALSWRGRLLAGVKGRLAAVVLSMLAHSWPDEFEDICRAVYPDYSGVAVPFFSSCGKIMRNSVIVADLVDKNHVKRKKFPVFLDEKQMEGELRTVADRLRFNDADRVAMFDMVRKWIVADWRVGPHGEDLSES